MTNVIFSDDGACMFQVPTVNLDIARFIRINLLPVLIAVLISAAGARANEQQTFRCAESRAFLAPIDSSEHRKYAPDREIDILHVALDITPDFQQRTISGRTTLTFKPIAIPCLELSLDAVDLDVDSVTSTDVVQGYQVADKRIIITFSRPIPAGHEAEVTIRYHAEPREGLYFRTPEMGYKQGETHLFTQGEAIHARHWYPCFDSPNEKFTSEVTCRVPEGMTVLSNGRLLSAQEDARTGLVAIRWLQDRPHVNYLISLVAGYFEKIEDKYRDIPLAFYTLPSDIREAPNSFQGTKDMLEFFERETGVLYPWAKYDQVCVRDFVAGGMENTSITTLTDRTLFSTETENIRSSEGLVSHELAHQWFGDLVTCKDWSHLWLNEGFATYYAHLYEGHTHGRDTFLYGLYTMARRLHDEPSDTKPIVDRKYDHPDEQFSFRAYGKGAWVLHMLRAQLGNELYRRCIRTYLQRHQFDTVVTEDLNAVIEELSGRSYDRFFDQWVYHAHYPELDVTYGWDEQTKLAKITIKQVQKLSADVLLFSFPLTVRFRSGGDIIDRQITVKEKEEDFYFPLTQAPQTVRIDPQYTLLARINFRPPDGLLYTQLEDESDAIGRLLAIEHLARLKDHKTVARLRERLNADPFHGVRIEAAGALRAIHTDEALEALIASKQQPDARVRNRVVAEIGGFYHPAAEAALRQVLAQEKNPEIVATAIRALGTYGTPEVREALLKYLESRSYKNLLVEAAIDALRVLADPTCLAALRDCLKHREAELTSNCFAAGLRALAHVAQNEEKKDEWREFLLRYVNHRKQTIQLGALAALGELEDLHAVPVLEGFARTAKDTPQQRAAEQALNALRSTRKPAEDLRELRGEILDLQKTNRELKKEIEDLKKKIEAAQTKAAPSRAKRPAPSARGAKL
jgi:aminopeptidase N